MTLRARANKIAFLAGAFLVLAAGSSARALTIQVTFDSSIVNAPNAADIENTINFATNEISSLFSNPGTVTILFKYSSGNFLGESNSSFYFDTYATVTSELQANLSANPQNAVLATALNNLSSGNDANGARDIEATSAEFRIALGDNTATPCFDASGTFVSGCNAVFDGVITLSSSQPIDFTRPVPAYDGTNVAYDGVRVAEHEIDEVLGGGGAGTMLSSPAQSTRYGILDLYRYSAPGTPSYTSSGVATSYFSIDGGNTDIVGFNQNKNGDLADWGPNVTACAGGGAGGPGFVQDAFSCNNVQADVTTSTPEYTMLQAIGYDPANTTPQNVVWDCSTNPDTTSHSGSIGATKSTGCTQVVLGTNTYTGVTLVEAGTLQLGAGGSTGSVSSNIIDNAALVFDRSDVVNYSGVISGSGSVSQIGTGTLGLSGVNTYSGATVVNSGTLEANAANTFSAASDLTIVAGASLNLQGFNETIGSLSGGGLVNLGSTANQLTVNGDNATTTFSGVIAGSGQLIKTGTGTLALTGDNTYSGGTTIASGTLQLGSGGTSGSLLGSVVDNGSLRFNRSDAVAFPGSVSGSGSLVQMGSGYLVLTGTNTYSGGTTIAGGALVLGNGGTTGSIVGNVIDNGLFYIFQSDTYLFGGVISGPGAFVQSGSGTTVLTATNTYSGGTIIQAGTLQLGNGGTTGSITGPISDSGNLVFNRSSTIVLSGAITGAGSVQQIGSGTTILTGDAAHTGGTTISGGTLQIGNGGTAGSIAGNIVDSASLTFDRSDSIAFNGSVSGSGSLSQTGAGYLVLTGANTYSGGTTVANGALVLGLNGTSGSIVGNVVDNSLFYVYRSDAYSFGGSISGTGIFVQSGSGTTTLAGANTYGGKTIIQAGTLQLGNGGTTGTIASSVVADSGALVFDHSDSLVFAGAISGSGSFAQSGSGFVVLTGNNTYTGGTAVSTGALVLGANGTSGSIVGNVLDNALFYIYRSDTYSFGGVISGSGKFVQSGDGTAILTADNTFSGKTIIQAGTLQIGNGSTSGSIASGIVADSGVLVFDHSDSIAYSGVVSGAGSLVQAGAGYLVLTGTNSYTGGTNVTSGALVLGLNGTGGSIAGNVTDNGLFYFYRSDNVGFGGTISGTGKVLQSGGGRTTLTSSANSYSGGTIVQAGTLEAGVNGAFAAGKVTLTGASPTLLLDNGINLSNQIDINVASFIDVNGTDSATISGVLVGSSPFEKDGTGTLTLNHDNSATYSGNISFHGHLVAGVTGAFGTGTVTDLGSVITLMDGVTDTAATNLVDNLEVVQDGGSATISAPIGQTGGPWGVTKTGVGTLFLTTANTYTGETFVDAGTLVVNGSIAGSALTVNATGRLKGTGTIGRLNVADGGTVAPGNSIGTLHVAGNVSFAPNSVYEVEANAAGQSDQIVAGGSATVTGGAVQVFAQPGKYAASTVYPILTAAGAVAGTFAGVTSSQVILSPSLSYQLGEVDLMLTFHPLASFAATRNQASVAAAIQGNFSGQVFNAVDAFASGQLPVAFDAASGEIHASLHSALLEENTTLRQAVLSRLHDADATGSSFWARPFGSWGAIDTDGNAATLGTSFSGITVGADTSVADGLRLGLDGGYGQMQGFAPARGSSLASDRYHAGVYGGFSDGSLSLDAGVTGSWGIARTARRVVFSGFRDSDTARQSTRTTQAFAEAAFHAPLGQLDLAPFFNIGWIEAGAGAFVEAGGAAALSGVRGTSDETFSTLGLRAQTDVTLANGADILPNASIGWMHAFHGLTPSRDLAFEATGESFTVLGVPLDQDQAIIDLAVTSHPIPGVAATIGYDGILSGRVRDNGVQARLAWSF